MFLMHTDFSGIFEKLKICLLNTNEQSSLHVMCVNILWFEVKFQFLSINVKFLSVFENVVSNFWKALKAVS